MKKIIMFWVLIFVTFSISGQQYLKIDHPDVADTTIEHYVIKNMDFYSISFYNSRHQVIKIAEKVANDNHKVSWEKRFEKSNTYYFYQGTLLDKSVTFDFVTKKLLRTVYVYNKVGKKIEVNAFVNQKLLPETILKLTNTDYYLNYPDQLPKDGWVIDSKEKREYLSDSLVAARSYFSYDEKGTLLPDIRKDTFVYNEKNQLVEYLSLVNNKSFSNLKQTYDYDCKGRLSKQNYYEDGKFQAENTISYSDTAIIEVTKWFEIYKSQGSPYNYRKEIDVYNWDSKIGKFYCQELGRAQFKLPNEID